MVIARTLLSRLSKLYPNAECALRHESAFQLVVATILSAQCTDSRVNAVTPELFRNYKTAKELAATPVQDVERLIRSTGFFHAKARSLVGMARMVMEQFNGDVPSTIEELIQLPGVARKTANVVLGTWYKKASGVVVDTHVSRIAARLGLTQEKDPKKIELDLMKAIPRGRWIQFSHEVIWHGRRICRARRPRCGECGLKDLCPSAFHVEPGAGMEPACSVQGRSR